MTSDVTPPAIPGSGPGEAEEETTLRVIYPAARGRLTLRGGSAGLDWFTDRAPDLVEGDVSTFRLAIPHFDPVQVKVVREDGAWMMGRNAVIGRGDSAVLRPAFDRSKGDLSSLRTIDMPWGGALHIRVRLPPSYSEQDSQRYPVLYAQDGQSIWSDGTDPFGTWGLDQVIDELWDVGALDEFIVVSIDTGEDRLNRLSPVKDPTWGGGAGDNHLRGMVEVLKPLIDTEYRTRPERSATTLLGSSMGGLFSFWATWTRPDIFGGAICLSSSFWWAERYMLRVVSGFSCPAPRPNFYLDSGAAASGFEHDASTRDGVHNTRAMYRSLREHCYGPGNELSLMSWTGHHHDARSWAGRVSTPLQIFFPRSV
jgi:predicted alpha/beta superfamily hydrolase